MAAKLATLALLGLFPLAWTAPLARAEVPWLFYEEDISILSGVAQLYETDLFLAVVVALFAIAAPYLKTVTLLYIQFSDREGAAQALPLVEILGRLSMVDVFLIAIYVVAVKGVESVEIRWGLYLFTGLVLVSIWAGYATWRAKFETRARPPAPPAATERQAEKADG